MPTMIAQHRVRDYDVCVHHHRRVYRNAADPNDLVLLFDVADETRARQFGASDDLQNIMKKAGVKMNSLSIKAIPD